MDKTVSVGRKRVLIAATAFVSILLLAAVASVVTSRRAATEKEMAKRYDQIHEAFKQRDLKLCTSLLCDDYVFHFPDGSTVGRGMVLAGFRKDMEVVKHYNKWDSEIKVLKCDDDSVTVHVRDTVDLIHTDDSGNTIHGTIDDVSRDLWVKRDSGWKLKETYLLNSHRTSTLVR